MGVDDTRLGPGDQSPSCSLSRLPAGRLPGASLMRLPLELIIPVMELLQASSHLGTLAELMRANRACHRLGRRLLHADLAVGDCWHDPWRGGWPLSDVLRLSGKRLDDLALRLSRQTNLQIRTLSLCHAATPSAAMLLASALPTLEFLALDARSTSAELFGKLWSVVVQHATPKLTELRLVLSWGFPHRVASFPPGLERLTLDTFGHRVESIVEVCAVAERDCIGLKAARLSASHALYRELRTACPGFFDKLVAVAVDGSHLENLIAAPPPSLRAVTVRAASRAAAEALKQLVVWKGLDEVELLDIETTVLPSMFSEGAPEPLSVVLKDAKPGIDQATCADWRADVARCKSKLIFRFGSEDEMKRWSEASAAAEREFWRSLPNVVWQD
ncbi:hypothetical protein DFJ74DRAFT_25996 [Hyaloraphidium curvatum]|nr:hypothetical protein DFJ74DRAFT_25996 [Hyaloraphidium curvatum]